MAFSQNGYSAKIGSLIASFTVVGSSIRIALRKGDVSVVLLEFLRRYNLEVESLRQSDTGGYNPRSIIGGNTLSNHASGTAVDTRWRDHPLGARGTFTPQQVAAIRRILRDLGGVIRWGGDYKKRKDEMHFEIVASARKVKAVADKIRGKHSGKPVVKDTNKGLKPVNGLTMGEARALQSNMNKIFPGYKSTPLTVDGEIGPRTIAAIKEFQSRVNLKADGIVGPLTRAQLKRYHVL